MARQQQQALPGTSQPSILPDQQQQNKQHAMLLPSSTSFGTSATRPLPPVQTLPLRIHLQPQLALLLPVIQPPPSPLAPLLPLAAPQLPVLTATDSMALPAPPVSIRQKRTHPRTNLIPTNVGSLSVPRRQFEATIAAPTVPPPSPVSFTVLQPVTDLSTYSTSPSVRPATGAVATMSITGSSSTPAPTRATAANKSTQHQERPSSPRPTRPAKKKRIRLKTDRRREQCRASQARYRTKQRDHAVVLEECIEQLRAQVRALEHQQHRLQQQQPTLLSHTRSMDVVREFFRLFQYGVASDTDALTCVPSSEMRTPFDQKQQQQQLQSVPLSAQQHAFLQATIAPALVQSRLDGGGDNTTAAALLDRMQCWSQVYADFELELVRSERVADDTNAAQDCDTALLVTAHVHATITHETIACVFPHLLLATPRALRLRQQLVDQRITFVWSVLVAFDDCSRVNRLESAVDAVASLLPLLQSVDDVALVLEQAQLALVWGSCISTTTVTLVEYKW